MKLRFYTRIKITFSKNFFSTRISGYGGSFDKRIFCRAVGRLGLSWLVFDLFDFLSEKFPVKAMVDVVNDAEMQAEDDQRFANAGIRPEQLVVRIKIRIFHFFLLLC